MAFIDHINLRIPEDGVDEAVEFYTQTLGFETWKLDDYREDDRTSFFFRLGENALINVRPKPGFTSPDRKNYDHFCILIDKDLDDLEKELRQNDYEILRKANPLGSQGRAPALYVEDPFGYVVELKSKPLD